MSNLLGLRSQTRFSVPIRRFGGGSGCTALRSQYLIEYFTIISLDQPIFSPMFHKNDIAYPLLSMETVPWAISYFALAESARVAQALRRGFRPPVDCEDVSGWAGRIKWSLPYVAYW